MGLRSFFNIMCFNKASTKVYFNFAINLIIFLVNYFGCKWSKTQRYSVYNARKTEKSIKNWCVWWGFSTKIKNSWLKILKTTNKLIGKVSNNCWTCLLLDWRVQQPLIFCSGSLHSLGKLSTGLWNPAAGISSHSGSEAFGEVRFWFGTTRPGSQSAFQSSPEGAGGAGGRASCREVFVHRGLTCWKGRHCCLKVGSTLLL